MAKEKLYEYNGELITINMLAGRVELAKSTIYKYLKQGYSLSDAVELGKQGSTKAFKNRSKTNNRTSRKYLYEGQELTVEEISTLEGISKEPLYRRLKKGMDVASAVIDIKKNVSTKYPFCGGMYSRYMISVFTGINHHYLYKNIEDGVTYTEDEIESIIANYRTRDIMMYQGMSLYHYCVKMSYNYNVIYYSIKQYDLTIDEAINQYLNCGQSSRFGHSYALGDVLLYHFLLKLNIDDRYVLDRIRKGRTEEEAIIDAIFLNQEDYKNKTTRQRLRTIYDEIADIEDISVLQTALGLDDGDIAFLHQKTYRVEEVMTQYHLFSIVALLQSLNSIEEANEVLKKHNVTYDELMKLKDELLDGFVKRDATLVHDGVKYVWRKEY